MSLFGNLFNKKEQSNSLNALDAKSNIPESEEDNLKEEDLKEKENSSSDGKGTLKFVPMKQEAVETYEILEREILPAKIICPDCGGITLEGLEFCDKCGGELL